jgi:hypothetical protein
MQPAPSGHVRPYGTAATLRRSLSRSRVPRRWSALRISKCLFASSSPG